MAAGRQPDDEGDERFFYAEEVRHRQRDLSRGIDENTTDEPGHFYGQYQAQTSQALSHSQCHPQDANEERKSVGAIPGLGLLGAQMEKHTSQNQVREITQNEAFVNGEQSLAFALHNGHSDTDGKAEPSIGIANSKPESSEVPQGDKVNVVAADREGSEMLNGPTPSLLEVSLKYPLVSSSPKDISNMSSSQTLQAGHVDEEDEYRFGSSDGESTTSSSSTSSTDSNGSRGTDDNIYDLLSPEEQARILMQEGGSDDERPLKSDSFKQPRTANETAEKNVKKPEITVTMAMNVCELGSAEGIVENFLLIRGKTSGENQVLESGSTLCLEDRTVIGVISETLGKVEAPLYSVAFASAQEAKSYGIENGTKVFFVEEHSKFVFTQPLKSLKGSDASNVHDEEVGDDEAEFSDDEAEAEHKRRTKQLKLGAKNFPHGATTPSNHLTNFRGFPPKGVEYPDKPINYDEDDGDEMYTPLARPDSLLEHRLPPKPTGSPKQPRGGSARGRDGRGRAHRFQKGNSKLASNERASARTHSTPHSSNNSRPTLGSAISNATSPSKQPHFSLFAEQSIAPMTGAGHSPIAFQNTLWPQSPHSQWNANNPYQFTAFSASYPAPERNNIPAGAFVNPAFFRNSQAAFPSQMHYNQSQGSGKRDETRVRYEEDLSANRPGSDAVFPKEEYDPTRPWIQ